MTFNEIFDANPKLNIMVDEDGIHSPIVLRLIKGEELTHEEMDANFAWLILVGFALTRILDQDEIMNRVDEAGASGVHLKDVFNKIKIDGEKLGKEIKIPADKLVSTIEELETIQFQNIFSSDALLTAFENLAYVNGLRDKITKMLGMKAQSRGSLSTQPPSKFIDGERVFDSSTKKTLTYIGSDKALYDAMGNIEYDLSGNE
jgi:hypothetical protein